MNIDHPMPEKTRADIFLHQLRQQTAQSHRGLESLPVSASITSPEVTKHQYAHYLSLMRDIIESFETRVFPLLVGIVPDLDARKKLAYLDADLTALDYTKTRDFSIFGSDYSLPFAIGMMYTIEGSTLGGRYIIKNIESVLDYDENHGARYFAGYGNKSGSYWKNFINSLTAYEAETDSADEIIAGADFAFKTIHNHFQQDED